MSIALCLDCAATIGAGPADWHPRTWSETCGAADCSNATIVIKVTDVEDVTWDVTITRCGSAISAVHTDTREECGPFHVQMLADFAAENLYDDIDAAWAARKG